MKTYPIASIFRSIQGEGHHHGEVTTFVRFAGCSVLNCSIRAQCDEAPRKATEVIELQEILRRVRSESPAGIVCLTGGEPSDHDLIPVLDTLRRARFSVHIETSGARSIAGMPFDWITVSPKTADYVQRVGHTLKLVVRPGMTWGDVYDVDHETSFLHRYLQPLTNADGTSNVAEVIGLLKQWENHQGRWGLSTQAHKTWGVP